MRWPFAEVRLKADDSVENGALLFGPMQEFSSVSASSYDPAALAAKLTEKSGEGWSVVSIVPTGGDVTAFLVRDADAAAPAAAAAVAEPAAAEPAAETTGGFAPTLLGGAAAAAATPEPTPAVAEPAGWAVAPEAAAPAVDPTPAATSMAPIGDTTSYQPAAQQTYQPAAQPAAAATPAVPAGWYADPAGRFELRYWDGSTWTEHVSRAGQQYTDPPVA